MCLQHSSRPHSYPPARQGLSDILFRINPDELSDPKPHYFWIFLSAWDQLNNDIYLILLIMHFNQGRGHSIGPQPPCSPRMYSLTNLCLAPQKKDIGKRCRLRSDTTECGVWSGTSLFELNTGISVNIVVIKKN